MTDTNSNTVDVTTDDLDAFSDLFHGTSEPAKEADIADEPEDGSDEDIDADNSELDDHSVETDEDEEAEEEETPEPEVKPKKNKKSFQERMDEVTREKYEALRRADALEARLQALEANNKTENKEPAPIKEEASAPAPDDVDENGELKYPLGEYDPKYIRDLTRHTIAQEREAERIREDERKQATEAEAIQQEIAVQWQAKIEAVKEDMPDFQEKGAELENTFRNLEPAYGQYLATTIMTMDKGPEVLYYLSNNIEEAHKIANLGPTQATIALGRLEARFFSESGNNRTVKVSNAPEPPPSLNKGRKVSRDIPDDTDDLDAFSAKFFKKK